MDCANLGDISVVKGYCKDVVICNIYVETNHGAPLVALVIMPSFGRFVLVWRVPCQLAPMMS